MYTVNDFFCGCGGLGLGLQRVGFKILKAWDFDKYAVQTYRENIGDHVEQADIKELHIEDVPKATAWAFGFPCQDLSVAGKQAGIKLECTDCGEVWKVDYKNYAGKNDCPKCGGGNYRAATRSGMFFEIMRLLQEADEREPDKLPKILIVENVKALGPYLPVLAAEYGRAGYKSYYQLFNSKWWGVPQNRERYIVIGIRDTLEGAYRYPAEQHEWIPKLSSVLEKDVPESFYIDDDKAQKIIDQALQRLAKMGNVHATITPDREVKRQNGRRVKEDEEEMFTLTAQDLHGVIQRQRKEIVPSGDTCASALIHSRGLETRQDGISHCIKGGGGGSGANFLVEKVLLPITEVCVNDRGFTKKNPQVSSIAPTLLSTDYKGPSVVIERRQVKEKIIRPVVSSAQEHATVNDDLCPALTAAAGMGGGQTAMVVQPGIRVVGSLGTIGTTSEHNNRVHDPDGIAPTATVVAGGSHHIKIFDYSRFRVRKLTPTEYGRLQGFPMDTWRQVVSNSQAYKQFGNAVTVPLAEAIGKSIIEFLKEQEAEDGKDTASRPG